MKNLILILVFSCGLLVAQAQKTLTLYNLTGTSIDLETLVTNTGTLGSYPECHMKPSGPITIAAFGTYVLTNPAHATRFPFYSPTSVPMPTTWNRRTSASASTNLPSNAAWLVGGNQVFSWIQVRKGANAKQVGNPINSPYLASETSHGWTLQFLTGLTVDDYIVNVY